MGAVHDTTGSVAHPDLQIRGEGGGTVSKKNKGVDPSGPSLGSATVDSRHNLINIPTPLRNSLRKWRGYL